MAELLKHSAVGCRVFVIKNAAVLDTHMCFQGVSC